MGSKLVRNLAATKAAATADYPELMSGGQMATHTVVITGEKPGTSILKATFKGGEKVGGNIEQETGMMKKLIPGGQAANAGVKSGMVMETLDGVSYSFEELKNRASGTDDYEVVFGRKVPVATIGSRVVAFGCN